MGATYKSQGIIFRTIKYSETSIICDIYTKEKGLRSCIASGVRSSKKGGKASVYRPANIVDFVAYDVQSDKLGRLKEISYATYFTSINIDVIISSIVMFMLEVCRNSIKEREANEELYQLIVDWIAYLDTKSNYHPALHLKFMIELSYLLGFGPLENKTPENMYFDMQEGVFCNFQSKSEIILNENESKQWHEIMQSSKENLHSLTWSKAERQKFTDILVQYYKLHVSGFKDLNTLPILRDIL